MAKDRVAPTLPPKLEEIQVTVREFFTGKLYGAWKGEDLLRALMAVNEVYAKLRLYESTLGESERDLLLAHFLGDCERTLHEAGANADESRQFGLGTKVRTELEIIRPPVVA
jgi:hypothetical protein